MQQIEWREEYAVDGAVIDEEHKSLIDMANRIMAIERPETCREEIIELVKGLFRYMETHFEHEEQLMKEAEVPDLELHARTHRRLIEEMTAALKTHTNLRDYTAVLRKLIGEWFVNHIVKIDKRIAEHLPVASQ